MLLWEALCVSDKRPGPDPTAEGGPTVRSQRLPYDRRCSALTKTGTRCRGQIRGDGEFCLFHDPEIAARRRAAQTQSRSKKRRRLSHLPDGYLRKLTSTAAIGQAMDRLYREVRLGIITTEMGTVLFNLLTRLMDAGLVPLGARPDRTKASRIRPKLSDLLTRQERVAWKTAVANAPASVRGEIAPRPVADRPLAAPAKPRDLAERPAALVLQAAS